MVLSMIGIIVGLVFLIVMVMKGWPLLIIGACAAMLLSVLSGLDVKEAYLTTYMGGVGEFLIGQIPIFLWGAVFGECYGITGGAKSIARWISRIFRGKNERLSPIVTIVIVFLAGILLSYGGVSAIVLMFVMAPLTMELCRESGIPRYMIPGMILGCIATAALSMPGSPKCLLSEHLRKQDRSRKRIKSDPVRKPFERSGDKKKVFAQVSKGSKKLLVISIEKGCYHRIGYLTERLKTQCLSQKIRECLVS